jgi:c-di-GMP-binding flagellar brake protein YcgR
MFGLAIFNKLLEHKKEDDFFLPVFFEVSGEPMKETVKDLTDYMESNTRISVGITKGNYAGVYDSRVEELTKKHVLIAHPTDEGVPVPMLPGTPISIEYVTNAGRYRFVSKVIDRQLEGNLSFIKIAIPETITRQQLREFFRVETRVKAKLKLFYAAVPDKNLKIPHKSVDCIVIDMSGGGGKLITEAWLEEKQQFALDLSAEMEELDNVSCTAVRARRIQEKTEVSFKFNFDKESERNPIIKYVFKRQIEIKQMLG